MNVKRQLDQRIAKDFLFTAFKQMPLNGGAGCATLLQSYIKNEKLEYNFHLTRLIQTEYFAFKFSLRSPDGFFTTKLIKMKLWDRCQMGTVKRLKWEL